MFYLILVTIIWGFSFSLIAQFLTGVNIGFSTFSRVLLAFILFIPFMQWRAVSNRIKFNLIIIGAIQIGLMSLFYYASFRYLSVPDILLFTIFTPIYIAILYDLIKYKRIHFLSFMFVLMAVLGAGIIRYQTLSADFFIGFVLIQAANLCFALGQVYYKLLCERQVFEQKQAFIWFYVGALIVTFCFFLFNAKGAQYPTNTAQWLTLLWLGVGASGAGYFLWNYGATKVSAGVLAMMNNAVIPIGLLINVMIFHQQLEWIRFFIGSAILLLAFVLHGIYARKNDPYSL